MITLEKSFPQKGIWALIFVARFLLFSSVTVI